jgi:hypothetical protein
MATIFRHDISLFSLLSLVQKHRYPSAETVSKSPQHWNLAKRLRQLGSIALPSIVFLSALTCAHASDFRGNQFIGFSNFSSFDKTNSDNPAETLLTSPEITAGIHFDQLIASWNAGLPEDAYLKIEARAIYPDHATKYYTMGLWSREPSRHPRESVPHQKDDAGDVSTDTLILKQPCDRLQLRVTLGGTSEESRKPAQSVVGRASPQAAEDSETNPLSTAREDARPTALESIQGALARLKFLGISLADTKAELTNLPPNQTAWGKTIDVPERSQMAYPNGGVLCSPTTVSMIMTYWSHALNRPELDRDVPEIVKELYDSNWHGAGNWPFNMAYAGSFTGMRAYVSRFSDVSELEDWIAAGLPVGLSVCYDRLRGKGPGPNGHLVVCVGFTKDGDVIINDPGTSKNVRKTFPRKNLIYAWANSHNAVYLIYPEDAHLPVDRFGHWDSSRFETTR